MCTTHLCIAFYVLTFCVFGWFGALALVMIKSSKEQGNSYVIDPLALWINSELINPARCFRNEMLKPFLEYLIVIARGWNKIVGSKPELNFWTLHLVVTLNSLYAEEAVLASSAFILILAHLSLISFSFSWKCNLRILHQSIWWFSPLNDCFIEISIASQQYHGISIYSFICFARWYNTISYLRLINTYFFIFQSTFSFPLLSIIDSCTSFKFAIWLDTFKSYILALLKKWNGFIMVDTSWNV